MILITRKLLLLICIICIVGTGMSGPAYAWQLKMAMTADKNGGGLLNPASFYIDKAHKRYYIVDSGHNRLVSFDKGGQPLQSFNAGGSLRLPVAMTRIGSSTLLVMEKGRDSLTVINLKDRQVKRHILTSRRIFPARVKLAGRKIYVLNKADGRVEIMNSRLESEESFVCTGCRMGFVDFSLLGRGGVAALTALEGEVRYFAADGKEIKRIKLSPRPDFAAAFAIDPHQGRIVVAERHSGHLKIYSSSGRLQNEILSRGERPGQLLYPIQVQFDPWGRLCVLDEGNGRLAVFTE
ncbi:hypothetical protein MNBD_DELTA03-499 [hydrothermal vent metagenome]|uniref:NHL repeat containing protein n=1 Tax=hydrothermal vent metagenome TaxID=652676 RepID=A0A3B0VNF1_9ZZZZ